MIKNRDIVIVGQQSWDTDIGSNCKNIAIEFSKFNRVLYVNTPLDTKTKWKYRLDEKVEKRLQVVRGNQPEIEKVTENFWTLYHKNIIYSTNWLSAGSLFKFFNKKNNVTLAKNIASALNKLDFKNIILFNDGDMFRSFYLSDLINPALNIYYSRDYFVATDYWRKHGAKYEPLIIQKANLCVANSVYLKEYCNRYNPNSYYVGQGCDLTDFFNVNRDSDDLNIFKTLQGRPIIGYVGSLVASRLDIDLLEHVAIKRKDWTIILVGPQDEVFKNSKLHKLNNIVFIKSQPPNQLAAFIEQFDVCINPQALNELTIGNYPRKIDEYLALGKPTVATKTVAMQAFEKYVLLAETKQDFVKLIEVALSKDQHHPNLKNERIAFAKLHSWENSVNAIYEAIKDIEDKKI